MIEQHEPIDHAQSSCEGQDRDEHPREDVIPRKEKHRSHRDRVARQKDKLNDPVDVSLRDVPVAGDAEIVIGVRALPEIRKLARRHIVVYIMLYHPDQRDMHEGAAQADGKDARKRKPLTLFRGCFRAEPQGKPLRHEAQAQRREQQQRQQRGEEFRRGPAVPVAEPEQEKKRQHGQTGGADPSLDFRIFLFHGFPLHGQKRAQQKASPLWRFLFYSSLICSMPCEMIVRTWSSASE